MTHDDCPTLTTAITALCDAVTALTHVLGELRTELQWANANLADRYGLGVVAPDDSDELLPDEARASRPLNTRCRECNATLARIEGEEVVLTLVCPDCGARYEPDTAKFIETKKT